MKPLANLEGLIWAGQNLFSPSNSHLTQAKFLLEMSPREKKNYSAWKDKFDKMPDYRLASAPDFYRTFKAINAMPRESLRVRQITDTLIEGALTATSCDYLAEQDNLVCTDEHEPTLTRQVDVTAEEFSEVENTPNLKGQIYETSKGYGILKTIFNTEDPQHELYAHLSVAGGIKLTRLLLPTTPKTRKSRIAFWNINNGIYFGFSLHEEWELRTYGVRK